LNENLKNKKLV